VAKDVLAIKAKFLRSKSLSDSVAEAHFNAKSNGGLTPKVAFDTSADITPPMPSDDPDEDADAAMDNSVAESHFNAKSNGGLTPKVAFDTSSDITPAMPSDDPDEDADAAMDTDRNVMDIDPNPVSGIESYIITDGEILSTGVTGVFPCTIRYMDLTGLGLKYPIRIPELTLLRNEWCSMVDIFNKRQPGLRGSAVFTGQPGIGEHCQFV
jgi:hypothetical protein